MRPRIAIVDDEPRMARVLGMVLSRDGHEITEHTDPLAFLEQVEQGLPLDLVLTDLKMPGIDGVELTRRLKALDPSLPVVLVTAHGTIRNAIEALKEGAFDFLEKPVDNDACRATVRRALEHTRLSRENRHLRAALEAEQGMGRVLAESEAMRAVLDLARRAARSRATVLITGESGTGKEVLARAIHVHSDRVGGPFVAVNCRALAEGVLESELFGHEKGAFTGAERAREGLFERAHGGTLFLDEIGEVDDAFQARLLRVLQEGEVLRVGGDRPRKVDVRVLAATNRDLVAEVEAGRFREDLYFRLAVIPLHIPPLRQRRDDVLPLARHFLARHASALGRPIRGWSPEVERFLLEHAWPGNVRELENAMERGAVLAREEVLQLSDLHPGKPSPPRPAEAEDETLQGFLDRQAALHIRQVLESCDGVRIEAARRLGIERTTLYRLLKKYGIDP